MDRAVQANPSVRDGNVHGLESVAGQPMMGHKMLTNPLMLLSIAVVFLATGCTVNRADNAPITMINSSDNGSGFNLTLGVGQRQTISVSVTYDPTSSLHPLQSVDQCKAYSYAENTVSSPGGVPYLSDGTDDLAKYPLPDLVRVVNASGAAIVPPKVAVSLQGTDTQTAQMTFEGLKAGSASIFVGIVCYPGFIAGGITYYTFSRSSYIRLVVQ
jgi:hypothetical protein